MTSQTAPSYVSTAFYSQYNLILLGGSALFALASASPVPLLVGIAGELVWLGVGPRLPVFRRKVEEQVDSERRAKVDDEVMLAMRSLAPEHNSRLLSVAQSISWIVLHAEARAEGPSERALLAELEGLRPVFLRLCQLQERLAQRLVELRLAPPEHEVARLSQAYAAEKDLGLRFTLHQSIKLAQRRIEQQSHMVDAQRQIELKLSLLEQSLVHLRNQQQLGAAWPDLARDIQGLLNQASGAAALESALESEL
jgi:hypothetical protein